jgi:uncharacterized protein (TIGR00369 family)
MSDDQTRDWAAELNRRSAGTMIAAHGSRFVEVSPERAVVELRFKPELTQMTGRFHAAPSSTSLDEGRARIASAHAMAGGDWDPQKFPLTVQLSANLIRNTSQGTLVAEALPIHKGRTMVVVQSTVKDEQGRLLATVTATQLVSAR